MIRGIRSDQPGFKNIINLAPGFNVILSDTTEKSTDKDSRNGTGKTSLIEIINFCLGSETSDGKGLMRPELKGWTFFLDLDLYGKQYTISRCTADPGKIYFEGDLTLLGAEPYVLPNGREYFTIKTTWEILGKAMFGLGGENEKHNPTFRNLISYFVRRFERTHVDAFKSSPDQNEYSKQLANAFLLNLNWEDASRFQVIKDKEKMLEQLRVATTDESVQQITGNLGELETDKIRLDEKISSLKGQMDSFKVHMQYHDIETQADRLTKQLHEISNENFELRQSVSLYEETMKGEKTPELQYLDNIYQEAKITVPDLIKRRLVDVQEFHVELIKNRTNFLTTEIEELRLKITQNDAQIKLLSTERAAKLNILKTFGALDELQAMNATYTDLVSKSKVMAQKIEALKKFQQGKSAVKIDKVKLEEKAKQKHEEIRQVWEQEVKLFNEYSMRIRDSPGALIVNIDEVGFRFNIKIERGESEGFSKMNTFCYDLALATIWSKRNISPGFLVHDSTLFGDVDNRQFAYALELAAEVSEKCGFQYICLLNSDKIPTSNFSQGFDITKYVRAKLEDTKEGCLFGKRF
ncbi:MAG: DUF2326 domain-containing protein [Candidatus Micrarchaeota archaeon]|nr:DUF2326 domain-containing protein [Candidatus Micrarchaeota archaeon]